MAVANGIEAANIYPMWLKQKWSVIILPLWFIAATGCAASRKVAKTHLIKPAPTINPLDSEFATVRLISKEEIQIKVGPFVYDEPIEPPQILAAALKKYRMIEKFRMTWSVSVASLGAASVLVYDRDRKTVQFDETGGVGDIQRKRIEEHHLFFNVTDAILNKLSRDFVAASGSPDTGFMQLPKYGCAHKSLTGNSSSSHPEN